MKTRNDYVLNHDYGYCREAELQRLNKLKLRNIDDLQDYVQQAIEDLYFANVQNFVIDFMFDLLKTEIIFEIIK